LVAGLLILAGCLSRTSAPPSISRAEAPVVRVRLMTNVTEVKVGADGSARTVRFDDLRNPAVVRSNHGAPVSVNDRAYRGMVRLVPTAAGIDVVNELTVDEYLLGVVPREVPAAWPVETLQAQSIIARTYALFEVRSRSGTRHWDLHPDERSQVYGGVEAEHARTNAAVRETSGLVAAFGPRGQEKIFKAYFSSTCGGVSQSAGDAWGEAGGPFKPRTSDGCQTAPRYTWAEVTIPKAELARRIKIWGTRQGHPIAQLDGIRTISVLTRNELGRPARFAVDDTKGRRFVLMSEQMRHASNTDRGTNGSMLMSSFFEPVDAGDAVRFSNGRGWGHGVGMCQWCANTWGRRGMSAQQIVEQSYPGAIVTRAY
jgi:stage II sporulation protein D